MRKSLLVALCLLSTPAMAQIGSGATFPPGNCNQGGGSLFYLTSGDAGLYICVNDEWTKQIGPGGGAAWGGITGTLSSQTDLQTALDGKQAAGSYLAPNGNGGSLTGLTKTQVGLANVDNTSDASKPVSTATQTALDAKQPTLVSATNIKTINGDSVLGSGDLVVSGAGLPAGLITLILSGTCPNGFEEVSEFNGKTVIGTLAANGNVGTTGGSDTITPAGSVAAPTFTGNASTTVVNHVHTLATGTGTTGNFAQVIGTVDTSSGGTGGTPTQTTLGTRTVATVGGAADYTPTGTISAPAFTGTQFDNRSAFIRVIFCRKT